jgi:hypothetical protein
LIGFDDDSLPEDAGTDSGFDSFLGVFTLPSAGTYYIAVTQFDNFPDGGLTCPSFSDLARPDGAFGGFATVGCPAGVSTFRLNGVQPIDALPYTMHVSLQSPVVATPEPTSFLLFGAGLLAFAIWGRKRNSQKG